MAPKTSREQYIREVFGVEMRFQHQGKPYVFTPFPSPEEPYLTGVVSRESSVVVGGPPEDKYAASIISDWETANVLIDPTGGNDGQKVAMQAVTVIGQPVAIFRSLTDFINQAFSDSDWSISLNPITTKEEFWTIAGLYKDHIRELDLTFVTPNIWGGESETEKALKKLKKDNNAQEVEVRLKNKDGKINPDSADVRQSVDYISRGGGSMKMKGEDGSVIYNSDHEENVVKETVSPDGPIPTAEVGLIKLIIDQIFK